MKFYNKKYNSNTAFTLIEMVLVMGIIALIAGAAIFGLTGIRQSAKENRVRMDIRSIGVALQQFENDNLQLPTTQQGLMALVERPSGGNLRRWKRYMKKNNILDPWRQPYGYKMPAQKSQDDYDLYSIGKDGVDGTEDDLGNWEDDQ